MGAPAGPTPPPGGYAPPPQGKKSGAKWGFVVLGVLVVIALGLGGFLIFGGGDDDKPSASNGSGNGDNGSGGDNGSNGSNGNNGQPDPADLPSIDGSLNADPLTVSGVDESGFDVSMNNIGLNPDGGFVAVGSRVDLDTDELEPLVWTSEDGEDWEEVDTVGLESGPRLETPSMSAIVSDGDTFVAIGSFIDENDDFVPFAWESPDLESWEDADVGAIDEVGQEEQMIGVTTDPEGGFLAVGSLFEGDGDERTEDPGVWRSGDGSSWQQVQTSGLEEDTNDFLAGVVSNEDGFVGVGSGFVFDDTNRNPLIWTSDDGEDWELANVAGLGDDDRQEFPLGVANAADGGFIAVGNEFDVGGSNRDPLVLVSDDGQDWEQVESGLFDASFDEIFTGVVPDGDSFLAGGVLADEPVEGAVWRLQFE